MSRRLLVTLPLTAGLRAHLLARLGAHHVRFADPAGTDEADLRWAEIVLGNLKPPMRLLTHRHIGWLHSPNVGLDAYDEIRAARPDLRVTNTKGIADHAVAEHALALTLALTRRLPAMVRAQDRREFDRDSFQGECCQTVAGRRAHVLGYGSIAQCLVRKLHGLGLRVVVYRREASGENPAVERFVALADLHREIGEAEVIYNLLPDVSATRGLLGAEVWRALRGPAWFINVGRGATVDETALVGALAEGRLRGAALDVFSTEPLPADSPLWSLPQVLISPHVAGRYDGEMYGQVDRFADLLARETPGEP